MANSIKIAKIIETKKCKFSVVELKIESFSEEELRFDKIETSCLSYQVEDHLMKYYDSLLVSTEEYDEYVDPFIPLIAKREKEEENARRERISKEKSSAEFPAQQKELEKRRSYLAWLEDYISDYAPRGYKNFKKDWGIREHGGKSAYYREGHLPDWLKDDLGYVPDEPLGHGMPWDRPRTGIVLSDEEYANKLLKEAREDVEAIERLLSVSKGAKS